MAGDAAATSDATVLIVGQGVLADALARRLPRIGLELERAHTSHAAQIARVAAPDLLVLVGDSAGDGGKRVLAQLAAEPSAAQLPVLVICGPSLATLGGIALRTHVAALAPEGGIDVCALRIQRLMESLGGKGLAGRTLQQVVDELAGAAKPVAAAAPKTIQLQAPPPSAFEASARREPTLVGVPTAKAAPKRKAPETARAEPAKITAPAPVAATAPQPLAATQIALPAPAPAPLPLAATQIALPAPPAPAPEPQSLAATQTALPAPAPVAASHAAPPPAEPQFEAFEETSEPVPAPAPPLRPAPKAQPAAQIAVRTAAEPQPPASAPTPAVTVAEWSDASAGDAETPLAWAKPGAPAAAAKEPAPPVARARKHRPIMIGAAAAIATGAAVLLFGSLSASPEDAKPAAAAGAIASPAQKATPQGRPALPPAPPPTRATTTDRATRMPAPASKPVKAAPPAPRTAPAAEVEDDLELDTPGSSRPERARKVSQANLKIGEGHQLLKRGHLGLAEAAYLKALAVLPEYPRALAGLARVHMQRKDGAEAVRWAERLVAKQPNRGNNQLLLGDAWALRGNPARARSAWQRAASYGNAAARTRLK